MTARSPAVSAHTVLRNYEVPALRVGQHLPTDDEYRMMSGDHQCRAYDYGHGACEMTSGHPGATHAITSHSGRIMHLWDADVPRDGTLEWW